MPFPSQEEYLWASNFLTDTKIRQYVSELAEAEALEHGKGKTIPVMFRRSVYMAHELENGKYELNRYDAQTIVPRKLFWRLQRQLDPEVARLERYKLSLRQATKLATELHSATKSFPFFQYWNKKNDVMGVFFSAHFANCLHHKLKAYRKVVQVSYSRQVASKIREFVLKKFPFFTIPESPSSVQKVLADAFGPGNTNRYEVIKKYTEPMPPLTGRACTFFDKIMTYIKEGEQGFYMVRHSPQWAFLRGYNAYYGLLQRVQKTFVIPIGEADKILESLKNGMIPEGYNQYRPSAGRVFEVMINLMARLVEDLMDQCFRTVRMMDGRHIWVDS